MKEFGIQVIGLKKHMTTNNRYYWLEVEMPNYEKYASDFLNYYVKYNSNFTRSTNIWHPLDPKYYEEYFKNHVDFYNAISKFGEINEISTVILFKDTSIHTDHTAGLNANVKARLNIPVLNCKDSYTGFFNFSELDQKLGKAVSRNASKFWPEDILLRNPPVCGFELCKPTILRTSIPHKVFCKNDKFPRISLTISFKDDVVKYLDEA